MKFFKVSPRKSRIIGPYVCSECGGASMFEETFLNCVQENIDVYITCPYCEYRTFSTFSFDEIDISSVIELAIKARR